MILISVLSFEYPTPPLTTVMDEMVPLLNTGVRTAPKPSPEMSMSGGELYLLPAFRTITLSITPLLRVELDTQKTIQKSVLLSQDRELSSQQIFKTGESITLRKTLKVLQMMMDLFLLEQTMIMVFSILHCMLQEV